MNTIAELFSRDPLEKPHTDEELQAIIAYMREKRGQFMLGKKAPAAKPDKLSLEDLGL